MIAIFDSITKSLKEALVQSQFWALLKILYFIQSIVNPIVLPSKELSSKELHPKDCHPILPLNYWHFPIWSIARNG
jgi:hypothetical protein